MSTIDLVDEISPYPFQELVLKKIVPKDRIALFLEMRLGKTNIAIWWLKRKNLLNKKILIVVPLSVVPVWEKELKRQNVPFLTCSSSAKELQAVIGLWQGVVITNYEALIATELVKTADQETDEDKAKRKKRKRIKEDIEPIKWDVVILDESQRIRNIGAEISKVCSEYFKDVKYKAILTGTPAPECLLDYYQQFKFLLGHFLGLTSYYDFKHSYFYTSYGNPKPAIKMPMVPIVKEFVQQNSIVLRRSNPLVMENLKNKKIYEQRFVKLSPEAQKTYDKFEENWYLEARNKEQNKDLMANWVIVAQNYLHQMSGGFIKGTEEYFSDHKLKEMKDVIEQDLPNERIVVFARFRKELDKIEEYFKDIPTRQINGSVDVRTRFSYIDELGNDKIKLLLCQIKTASVGINISCASTVFYYSNTWEMVDRLQSEDRIVGPKTSKDTSLFYMDFLTSGTIDVDLYNALQAKKENTDLDFLEQVYKRFRERIK